MSIEEERLQVRTLKAYKSKGERKRDKFQTVLVGEDCPGFPRHVPLFRASVQASRRLSRNMAFGPGFSVFPSVLLFCGIL